MKAGQINDHATYRHIGIMFNGYSATSNSKTNAINLTFHCYDLFIAFYAYLKFETAELTKTCNDKLLTTY